MERYLEEGTISKDELDKAIQQAIAAGTLIPIFCISSKDDVGVTELMDAMAAFGTGSEGNRPHRHARVTKKCRSTRRPTARSLRRSLRRESIRSSPR